MDKLEKVIKGLDICLSRFNCGDACPYKQEDSDDCMKQLKDDVLELLKEKQPKKGHWVMKHRHRKSIKFVTGIDKWGEEHGVEFVEESEGDEPYCSECGAAAAESFQNFCPKCGADMRGEHE